MTEEAPPALSASPQFRALVLDGPWKVSGRGTAVSVAVLQGQVKAPARLVGGGRVVGVSRPLVCFGTTPDPYPVELLVQGLEGEIVPGDELVGVTT